MSEIDDLAELADRVRSEDATPNDVWSYIAHRDVCAPGEMYSRCFDRLATALRAAGERGEKAAEMALTLAGERDALRAQVAEQRERLREAAAWITENWTGYDPPTLLTRLRAALSAAGETEQ